MTLGQLFEFYNNGALKVKHEDGVDFGEIGGVKVTIAEANQLCTKFGWLEHYVDSFKAISKMNSFIGSLKKAGLANELDQQTLNTTNVTFQNIRGNTYGTSYDRIVLTNSFGFGYTIIHGMEHNGGSYVIYETGHSLPVEKCRTVKKVAEFLATR